MEDKFRISKVVEILKVEAGIHITNATVINWCHKYKIGQKYGSYWYLNRDEIEKIISGEMFIQKYRKENL
jgi:hypothetical protein